MVTVDVEYCGVCNYKSQCQDLSAFIKKLHPSVEVSCHTGRTGSFEVSIDGNLLHSKLQTLAFPDFPSVAEQVKNAEQGDPLTVVKEQPITNCAIQ